MDGLPTEMRWMIFGFLGKRNLKTWGIMVRISKTWRGDVMGWIRFRHGGNPVSLIENCIKGGDVTLLKLVMKMPECKEAFREEMIDHERIIERLVAINKHPMMVLYALRKFSDDGGYFRTDILSLAAEKGNYKIFVSLYDNTTKDAYLCEAAASNWGKKKIMRILIHDRWRWDDEDILNMYKESETERHKSFIRDECKNAGRNNVFH